MFLRIDKLQIEMPRPTEPDPNAAAAVQELLGGRFGEMSTLMNYMYQSFNFRQKQELKPYYDLVASITAEETGHVELVAATINNLLDKAAAEGDPSASATMAQMASMRNSHHFIVNGQTALCANSMGQPWQGDYVFNSGNLVLDLLHNFFLENGARTHKLRVYEMTDHPVARTMIGYLLVRGGVHAAAYGKALQQVTGVEMTKMLPIPKIENADFPEARKWEEQGAHRKLYTWSHEDFADIDKIWTGTADWADGGPLEVVPGTPEGAPVSNLSHSKPEFAPEYEPEEVFDIAKRLMRKM
jgi:Mn-containing catalase